MLRVDFICEFRLDMWTYSVFVILLVSDGASQVFEGSGGDSGDTIAERFVESSTDPSVMTSLSTSNPTCIEESFPGLGFKINGIRRTSMFVCANGLIRFSSSNYQHWPFIFGTLPTQQNDPSLAPYWARIDLTAFATKESEVRLQSYHKDVNPKSVVFDRINNDVMRFKGYNSFNTTWASVITWENIKPHNPGNFGGRNTFQAVIASNETSWYVIYNYADIDWAVPVPRVEYSRWQNSAGLPVMGWNTGKSGFDYINGQQYQNLPYSGTVNSEDIDDVIGNLGTGRWIFDLSGEEVKSAALMCYEWYMSVSNVQIGRDLPCPPFLGVASVDKRFEKRDFQEKPCFLNLFPKAGPAVRCCYDNDSQALLTFKPSPGSVLSANPLYVLSDDDYGYQQCCVASDFCEAYFTRRPKIKGSLYKGPSIGSCIGDPHFMTLDKLNYTYNGCGEFMYVNGNNFQFQIQIRLSTIGLGTVISAVVIKQQGGDTIQLNFDSKGGMLFFVNGTEYSGLNLPGPSSVTIQQSYFVSKSGVNKIAITTSDQHWVEVTREDQNLVLALSLENSLFGKTKGLLGNWSGTTDDDFLLPDGTVLSSLLTDEQIHFKFGEKWRLTARQSLFINTSSDGNFSCLPDFRPMFPDNISFPNGTFEAEARSICGGNKNCLFDIAATRSTSFGQATLAGYNAIENDLTIAENSAPIFTTSEVVFNLTLGETFRYIVSVADSDGDDINVTVTGLPNGATTSKSGNNLTFEWMVDRIEKFDLTFTATDSKDASTVLVPTINVCACKNNGICFKKAPSSPQTALIFSHFNVLNCRCPTRYTGEFCEALKNFCETTEGSLCHPRVNCTNSASGFICGPCPAGYEGNGQNCSDIDECTKESNTCEQLCANTAGSFECQCNSGYQLNDDEKSCDDINECISGHDCMHNCTNSIGSFSCSCKPNFIIDPNNTRNCIPKTACTSAHNCQHVCFVDENTGAQQCSCHRGYRPKTDDNTKCVDVDECQESTDRCSQHCSNNQGSYTCSCIHGYRLHSDMFTCEDINECTEQPNSCKTGEGEKCVNLPGHFACDCNDNQGLVRINGTCQVPLNGQKIPVEQASDPPTPTQAQSENSVQLRISNFQSNQWDKPTDTAFRRSIAAALTRYCNANEERRVECSLPGNGFVFSELHINRLPNNPIDEGSDALISFYAVYPNGTKSETNVPVPQSVLLNVINEEISLIQQNTGLKIAVNPTPASSKENDGTDLGLVLGISIGLAVFIAMVIAVACMRCSRQHNLSYGMDQSEASRRARHFSFMDSDFTISGEVYPGFDEDGLPAEPLRAAPYTRPR